MNGEGDQSNCLVIPEPGLLLIGQFHTNCPMVHTHRGQLRHAQPNLLTIVIRIDTKVGLLQHEERQHDEMSKVIV